MKIEFDFTNVPQEDIDKLIKEFNSKIAYIASGSRDNYIFRQQLEDKLKEWHKPIRAKLKELGIGHKNTSYSSWDYGYNGFTIAFPYTLDHTTIKKEEDFSFYFVDYVNKPEGQHCDVIKDLKTIEEVLVLLAERNLFKIKE